MVCAAKPTDHWEAIADAIMRDAIIDNHRAEVRWHSGSAAFFGALSAIAVLCEAWWSLWILGPFTAFNLYQVWKHRRAVRRLEKENL